MAEKKPTIALPRLNQHQSIISIKDPDQNFSAQKEAVSDRKRNSSVGATDRIRNSSVGASDWKRSTSVDPKKSIVSIGSRQKDRDSYSYHRRSYGFNSVQMNLFRKSSTGTQRDKRPPLIFLPTYQLNSLNPFVEKPVEEAVKGVLEPYEKHTFMDSVSIGLARQLALDIMHRVREFRFNRYRIISVVTIGQKRSQCYNNAIAFLWDHERDSYVDVHMENPSCFIQATVFGIYFD